MARWWFARHGESDANVGRWLAGRLDVALTPTGAAQAEALGAQLRDLPFERVLTSRLSRARHTARLAVRRDVPWLEAAELNERALGDWVHRTIDSLRETGDIAALLSWSDGPPGGESARDVALRALPWLAELDPEPATLVVAHGGVLRTLLGLLDDVSVADLGRTRITNCALLERDIGPGTWAALQEHALSV